MNHLDSREEAMCPSPLLYIVNSVNFPVPWREIGWIKKTFLRISRNLLGNIVEVEHYWIHYSDDVHQTHLNIANSALPCHMVGSRNRGFLERLMFNILLLFHISVHYVVRAKVKMGKLWVSIHIRARYSDDSFRYNWEELSVLLLISSTHSPGYTHSMPCTQHYLRPFSLSDQTTHRFFNYLKLSWC